ncbi:BCCT family transporter [Euhalothece natronophila Z-M001]|uniref:BCCT family transporter n=1 Tax=Euhalothece natronophila Z-M001 TaxID=522448 RepID=A0A5B8NLB5_9CHRO|nr:BCCT family transporter [Euhalothece natronophila]QDZ39806.1 BCCT family transporter [Euhalothece natronophila Z-M001]
MADNGKNKDFEEELLEKETGYTPGSTNFQKWGLDLHPVVAPISAIIVLAFVVPTIIFPEQAETVFEEAQDAIASYGGWFYVLVANIFLGVIIIFAFSKFGRIRLGGQDAEPEFSTFAWFAMLLSAGMGIGLMFWSVGEPIFHFSDPPVIFGSEGGTPEAAETAMTLTFYHWGLHPWGLYALVGLGLAFFTFNRGLPLTMRSIFYPLIGERIYGIPGDIIDILAVVANLFGLATSLGLGVQQVATGIGFLFEAIPTNVTTQVILIAVITGFATLSVVAGLDGGVRRLSELNLVVAAVFMGFVIIVGPTLFIFDTLVQNLGNYIARFPMLSFWTESFEDGEGGWQNAWTIFYWGWWISWSPFVGMFIARVSRGRTIREFVMGVLIIPSLLSFLWLSAMGGAALNLELNGVADMVGPIGDDVSVGMFVMLENLPLVLISSLIAITLVTVFFVTSSDSGSLVVDNLTSGGKLDSPVTQRVFWAIMEGVVAAALLIGGGEEGLIALQTAAITTGLPFAFLLLVMCYSLNRGLGQELRELEFDVG